MAPGRSLHIKCGTWDQVEAFYQRKLRRGIVNSGVGYQGSDVLARPIAQYVSPRGAFAPLRGLQVETSLEQQAFVFSHSICPSNVDARLDDVNLHESGCHEQQGGKRPRRLEGESSLHVSQVFNPPSRRLRPHGVRARRYCH